MISRKGRANQIVVLGIGDLSIPLEIIYERRSTIRVSLGKDKSILRAPSYTKSNAQEHIEMARNWLNNIYTTNRSLLDRYSYDSYKIYNSLCILERDNYTIKIFEKKIESGIIKIGKDELTLEIPETLNQYSKRKIVRDLISKILVKRYKSIVYDRIQLWNIHFFKKEIKSVSLKYNTSNWGSCSTGNRINISTRCLLLPLDVFDYIIVHELAHLIEMNHSPAFWEVVKSVMPNYEEKELWLKLNGNKLEL